jgi:hypothetical protein
MTEHNSSPPGAGYVTTEFPIPGLSRVVRHITGHNAQGQSVFLSTDCGDHHRVMGEKQALSNIIYSTHRTPIELNGDEDIKYAKEHEVFPSLLPFRCRKRQGYIIPVIHDNILLIPY